MKQLQKDGGFPKNWVPWIYFEGYLWGADKIGNNNLGYVGTRMGFADYWIQNQFTMDKDDRPAVTLGVSLAIMGRQQNEATYKC